MPGHRIHLALEKLKITSSSRPQHWRTILLDWENKCILATKQHRGVHNDTLHQSQNTNSLRDTRNNTTHMIFEGELAAILHAKDVKVAQPSRLGPAQMEIRVKTQSPWGGFRVPDLLTTKALVLFGFSIMHQCLHISWIQDKYLIKDGSNSRSVYWLPNNWQLCWVVCMGIIIFCSPKA